MKDSFQLPSVSAVLWVLLLIGLLPGSAAISYAHEESRQPWAFERLPGPHQVGTLDYFWVDEKRGEPYTSDPGDQRHLLVRVWYPAGPAGDDVLAPYFPELSEFEAETAQLFKPLSGLQSRSHEGIALLEGNQKFPVLIYNHGGSWSRITSSFVTEAMASLGYVVFSIDHTGFNRSIRFPDGYEFVNDALPTPKSDPDKDRTTNARALFDFLGSEIFELWTGDVRFTLDQVELLANQGGGFFSNRLDLDRIGAFGWSFGGATAIQSSRDDPRIKAAMDHDGQLFGDVREKGTERPFMLLHSSGDPNPENDPAMAALIDEVQGFNEQLIEGSSQDWYEVVIGGSNHGSFSDLPLLAPDQAGDGLSGAQVARIHRIIVDLTRDFFDHYLRGHSKSPLLNGELDNYPELEFTSSTLARNLADQRVPMRDGIELSTDIHLPEGDGPFPTVLVRTPYVKDAATYARYKLERYVAEGYAVAFQDTRGQGLSGGEFNFYFPEGQDGYDTIEWIAIQPWSNGKVAMDGGSYLGTVQWLAALERPPHLECIMPHVSSGRIFDEIPYSGGAFVLEFALPWIASRYPDATAPADEEAAMKVLEHRPLLTMDEVYSGIKIPLYRNWLEHSTLDDYWQPIHVTPQEFATVEIPALTVTGWFDGDQPGALFYWSGMRAHSPAADQQYLVIGPWRHADTYLSGPLSVGEIQFSARSVLEMQTVRLGFLDWCLKGETEFLNMPRALVYLTGADRWLELDEYPAATTKALNLYLKSGGKANTSHGDGRLGSRPPFRSSPDQYVFDPKNPVPTQASATDHSKLEEREDVLVYTGPVLKDAVAVLGTPFVELYASSDARDTDFTAKLLDVLPDGRALKINHNLGVLRARYRNGFQSEELLTPNQPTRFRIELSAVGHVFQPGHRIRIEISSSDFPHTNPNQNTGNPVATDTEWRTANQSVHHSRKYPSRLELPVIPVDY